MSDNYLLIANQLKDFHHLWCEKIKGSRTYSPRWTVSKDTIGDDVIEELAPLLILANLLDRLGGNVQNSAQERLENLEQHFANITRINQNG